MHTLLDRIRLVDSLRFIVFSTTGFLAQQSSLVLFFVLDERTIFSVILVLKRPLTKLLGQVDLMLTVLEHISRLQVFNFSFRCGRGGCDGFEGLLKLTLLLFERVQLVL